MIMRARSLWVTLTLGVALPVLATDTAFAHGKNDLNRNHPARVDARTGNFRRAAVIKAAGASTDAWVRPLARAIAFSSKDQRPVLNKISSYRKHGEELALVALVNGTGTVKVVAIPKNKKQPVRVLKTAEVHKLGLSTQSEVIPGLLSRVSSKEYGPVPAKDIRRASLSTSGLSYQGRAMSAGNWKPSFRPLEPGEHAVRESYLSLPITAKKQNLSGAYITGWVTTERTK
jgi:hypothetical protein